MAHLWVLRYAPSFVEAPNAVYGSHEVMERNINQRQYKVKARREGYTCPFSSEIKFLDYRVKEDVLPDFVCDLKARVLNPDPNNARLLDVVKGVLGWKIKGSSRSVGGALVFVQWCFKWLNRKKTSSSVLIGLSVLGLLPWGFSALLVGLLWVNPLRPVRVSDKSPEPFFEQWQYNFVLGRLKDPIMKHKVGSKVIEEVEDVL